MRTSERAWNGARGQSHSASACYTHTYTPKHTQQRKLVPWATVLLPHPFWRILLPLWLLFRICSKAGQQEATWPSLDPFAHLRKAGRAGGKGVKDINSGKINRNVERRINDNRWKVRWGRSWVYLEALISISVDIVNKYQHCHRNFWMSSKRWHKRCFAQFTLR